VIDVVGLVAVCGVFGGGTVVAMSFSPIGRVIAERLRGKHPPLEALDEIDVLKDRIGALHEQVSELAERQDFAERMLAQARERGALGAGTAADPPGGVRA